MLIPSGARRTCQLWEPSDMPTEIVSSWPSSRERTLSRTSTSVVSFPSHPSPPASEVSEPSRMDCSEPSVRTPPDTAPSAGNGVQDGSEYDGRASASYASPSDGSTG